MSKNTFGSEGYQNVWSFDHGNCGYSRGMATTSIFFTPKLQAQTKNAAALTLADSSSANQVWGLSYAGNDSQMINAYYDDSVTSTNRVVTYNNNGTLDIGSLFLTNGSPQNSQFFSGSISALLMWDRQLTDVERLEVETYLTDTYVTGSVAVPEPSSSVLGLVGLITGFSLLRRRKLARV